MEVSSLGGWRGEGTLKCRSVVAAFGRAAKLRALEKTWFLLIRLLIVQFTASLRQ